MNIISVIFFSYLLGSVPTAFIFGKIFFRTDVTRSGSGNVGTLNFLRVTRSRLLALLVLLIDTAKGYLTLYLTSRYFSNSYLLLASIFVIAGHIFPVWLKGKGGRGMATLAGLAIYCEPVLVGIWWILFGLIYAVLRKYIISGMIALFSVNLIASLLFQPATFLILSVNSLLVMLKYIKRIQEEINK